MRRQSRAVMVVLTALVWPLAGEAETPVVTFNHAADADGSAKRITLKAGEVFEVRVINSDAACELEVTGIPVVEPEPEAAATGVTKSKKVIHDPSFGGYFATMTCDAEATTLRSRRWLVFVREAGWNVSFAGGFTISRLVDPIFEARTEEGGTQQRVQRNSDKESEARLGLAAFVHVFDERWPWWLGGLAFGLGIKEESRTDYYLGTGVRLGEKAFVTLGANWGPVKRLPDGIEEGDLISDVNTLANLPARTDAKFFLALSYRFLDVRALLEKPFAASEGSKPDQKKEKER